MSACPSGHQNPPDYRFCGQCGASVGGTSWPNVPLPQESSSPLLGLEATTPSTEAASTPGMWPSHGKRRRWSSWSRGARVAATAGFAFIVVVLVVAAVSIAVGGEDGRSATPSAPVNASTLDDWERAVCRPGTLQDGAAAEYLPHAGGTARCFSRPPQMPLLIGAYPASSALESDMAALRAVYATTTTDGGKTVVFLAYAISNDSAAQTARAALSPLTQFGFAIHDKT